MQKINNLIFILFITYNINTTVAEEYSKIDISELRITRAHPTASVLAGYASLSNNSEEAITLISVSCPLFSSIEIHRSFIKNDVASMERLSSLEIPAQSVIRLKPGDYHLMLFNPKKLLEISDTPTLIFSFSNGYEVKVRASIKNNHDH